MFKSALISIYSNEAKRLFFSFILLGDNKISIGDKVEIALKLFLALAPVAYMLEILQIWFRDNREFSIFTLMAILLNMGIGGWYHFKYSKQFNWSTLLKKTSLMMLVLIVTYYLLEQIRIIIGHNVLSDGFKVAIQVATLFYPTSKTLKNIYIMSNKEYPPAWIMERVYNFEKTGDVEALLKPNPLTTPQNNIGVEDSTTTNEQ